MQKRSILEKLDKKETNADELAEEVGKNLELIPEIFEGISSEEPRIRYGCAKILRTISKEKPEELYLKIDFFIDLLDGENNILKWNAIDVIANLTLIDSNNKLDGLFKKYYGLLYDGGLITAGHVVDNSGIIARAKPELRDKITKELLEVEKIPLPTKECTNILIGKTIRAFDSYYDNVEAKDKGKVISFVKRQINNTRNATRNKAKKFLAKRS